jgi:hypothetical protein
MHVPDLVTGPRPAAAARTEGPSDRPARRGDAEAEDFGSVVEKGGRKPAHAARPAEPAPGAQAADSTVQVQPVAIPETPALGLPPVPVPAAAPGAPDGETAPAAEAQGVDAPAPAAAVALPVASVPVSAAKAAVPGDARQAAVPAVEATRNPVPAAVAAPLAGERGADQGADPEVPLPMVTDRPQTARAAAVPAAKPETRVTSAQAAFGQPATAAVPPEQPADETGDAVPVPRAGRDAVAQAPLVRPVAHAAPQVAVGDAPVASAAGPGPEFTIREASAAGWRLTPAAATAHAPADQTPPATGQALAAQITLAVGRAEDRRVEIRLDPPELGRVQIHLNPRDGGLQAVVIAERPETHDLLRRHADTLTRDLNAAGYDSVSLDFTAGGQPTPGRDEAPVPEPGYVATPAAAQEQAAAAPARRGGASGLDVRL